MPIPIFADDIELALGVMARTNVLSATEQLRDAIALALATERERCAKIAEEYRAGDYLAKNIASAIRQKRR